MLYCDCKIQMPDSTNHCKICHRELPDTQQLELRQKIDLAAHQALAEGVPISDEAGGPVHLWVLKNVAVSVQNLVFAVWLIAWRMADIMAQAEGFESDADRAMHKVGQSLCTCGHILDRHNWAARYNKGCRDCQCREFVKAL